MSHYKIPDTPHITITMDACDDTPNDIAAFLAERGWEMEPGRTSDDKQLWTHSDDLQGLYYYWSEAVAYEFYRFLNLGKTTSNPGDPITYL